MPSFNRTGASPDLCNKAGKGCNRPKTEVGAKSKQTF